MYQSIRILTFCSLFLPLSMHARTSEPNNARDREAAIRAGNFNNYVATLGQWISRKVSTGTEGITRQSMGALLEDPEFMSAVIERRFLTRVWGEPSLGSWVKADAGNREFLAWLMSDAALMDEVMLARTPTAEFARIDDSWSVSVAALENWKKIYQEDPASRSGLYLKLAVACVLRPPGSANIGAGQAAVQSSVHDRYMHYREAHAAGELFPSFDTLTVWEMTHVVSACASNADLAWGREALNTWKPGFRQNEDVVAMVSQVWRRDANGVPYNDMSSVMAAGGKCGPRSSFGVFINQAFGIPSIGVGQPGHAAITYRRPDGTWQMAQGRGFNVSKITDRYNMTGDDFLAFTTERNTPVFARIEHLRWLAGTLEKPDGGYVPPADRKYVNARAAAVMELANALRNAIGKIAGTPFDRRPDRTSELRSFEAPTNDGEFYDARVRGFVHPPKTGDYVFGITSDDDSDLFLSTDESPDNKVFITHVSGWSDPADFSRKSRPIRLEQGKKYYIEAVHRELDGGDHLTVVWSGPGLSERVIQSANLSHPSAGNGRLVREVWNRSAGDAPSVEATAGPAMIPEAPIHVAPGVIHVEAEDFFNSSNVSVEDCHTGGKQVYYPALTTNAWCGYKIQVPETGTYRFEARVATVNWGQKLYVRSFGAMYPVKEARASNVYRNQVELLGPQQAIDQDLSTRWAMDFGKDEGWLELNLGKPRTISKLIIDERALNYVCRHKVEYKVDGGWKTLLEGDYIEDYVKSFPPVTAQYVRLSTFDVKAPTGGPTLRDFSVGEVLDGNGFIDIPWAPASEKDAKGGMSGRWQTTEPLEMFLVQGEQTIWVCTQTLPGQRSVALRWFELSPQNQLTGKRAGP